MLTKKDLIKIALTVAITDLILHYPVKADTRLYQKVYGWIEKIEEERRQRNETR